VFILAASSRPTIAEQPLSIEVQSAKSIYLVNETGDDKVLAAAIDQFTSWGRFAISPSPADADLVITFTHIRTAAWTSGETLAPPKWM
jgi:hypothetical protein